MDNNVHLLVLPPHSSHALQPLDVGVFKSTKCCWSTTCLNHFSDHPDIPIGKSQFPSLLKLVFGHMTQHPEHVVSGFKACGFRPFDRHAVDHKMIGEGQRLQEPPARVSRNASDELHTINFKNSLPPPPYNVLLHTTEIYPGRLIQKGKFIHYII